MKPSVILLDPALAPEATAMVQALYSRSPRPVAQHLEKVAAQGADGFMSQYYIGYGHNSIGDCGSATICFENVSMLAAKAIQDWQLYNGQEASTRYLDMTTRPFHHPEGAPDAIRVVADKWMALYTRVLAALIPALKEIYPDIDKEGKVWEKAINARAFDIARGFLPAGITTFVSWHSNLRQFKDHLRILSHHPLAEVRDLAGMALTTLKERFSASFTKEPNAETEAWLDEIVPITTYTDETPVSSPRGTYTPTNQHDVSDFISNALPREVKMQLIHEEASAQQDDLREMEREMELASALQRRPKYAEIPSWFKSDGQFTFKFALDFGSFRDLQRHRSCNMRMPLLTAKHGIHDWYLAQLMSLLPNLADDILRDIASIQGDLDGCQCDPTIKQYYVAMGYKVGCTITCNLNSAVYIAEIRSTQAVHPTLREVAQAMAIVIKNNVRGFAQGEGVGLTVHADMSPDIWSTKRGKQDIVERGVRQWPAALVQREQSRKKLLHTEPPAETLPDKLVVEEWLHVGVPALLHAIIRDDWKGTRKHWTPHHMIGAVVNLTPHSLSPSGEPMSAYGYNYEVKEVIVARPWIAHAVGPDRPYDGKYTLVVEPYTEKD